jgi:hypothetical protein
LTLVALLGAVGILSTGCASNSEFKTFLGKTSGVCDAFPRPEYQVLGKTEFDQQWADRVTEAGIAGCEWKRPEARPVVLDAPAIGAVLPKPAPVKKLSMWKRVKAKFHKKPKVETVS